MWATPDPLGVGRRHAEAEIDQPLQLAALLVRQPDRDRARLLRPSSSPSSTFGELPLVEIAIAASPLAAVGLELPREGALVAVVVARSR
jgi:hypothetical protein